MTEVVAALIWNVELDAGEHHFILLTEEELKEYIINYWRLCFNSHEIIISDEVFIAVQQGDSAALRIHKIWFYS